ncbi:hypothetical protein NLU13_4434 [Sarocladium strictum]|uniref:Uncharacterized protein n=1 Tax=Sarocladium strictum TaxID=5046 RepID=A0AA39L8W6_SARSR|nr:hypothetical protein NLU13_4434 [Sarocladium strictum]
MRSYIFLGAAALAAASPALTGLDFAAIEHAPAPTGPAVGIAIEESVYDPSTAASEAEEAASDDASSSDSATKPRRTDLLLNDHKPRPNPFPPEKGKPHNPPAPTSTRCAKSTSTTSATLTTTSAPSTSHVVPSSCTPISWTNTFAFTSDTACPTPYEVGTYCGFINPDDPCALQPGGFGPVSSPDTVQAFLNNGDLHKMAKSASDPRGYKNTFKDLSAAVNANTYLGYRILETYDVQACADWCDGTDLCTSFNVFIERDPKWNPYKCSCEQPDSITNFKCSLWGSGVDAKAAVNDGQYRGDFEVRIVGSNGYQKTEETVPKTPDGCENPQKCPAAHDHSSTCIGEHFFPGPFDVAVCA